jgi:hypothetical protein
MNNEMELLSQQTEMQELTHHEPVVRLTPTERITANEKLLAAIGPIIKKDHTIKQDGKLYVKYAGGAAIANALGYHISTSKPEFCDNAEGKYYECTAYLMDGGKVIAEAIGVLGMDEPRWADAEIYAKRSMCQTRAGARVCRQNFAHFYIAIGASDTPWEEIPTSQPSPQMKRVTSRPAASTAAPGNDLRTIPTDENGNEPVDGVYNVTKCELKREGEGANGPWHIHTIHTAEGYSFDSFNVNPNDFTDEAIAAGMTAGVKQVKQTKYGFDAKYIDAIKPADAAKVVVEVPSNDEIPF